MNVKRNLTVKWGMLSQKLGVIITHWKDVCLLKSPDAAFQEDIANKSVHTFLKSDFYAELLECTY